MCIPVGIQGGGLSERGDSTSRFQAAIPARNIERTGSIPILFVHPHPFLRVLVEYVIPFFFGADQSHL